MQDDATAIRAFIAQRKLGELKRYRARLFAEYDAVEAAASAASTPVERLRALYDGLRSIQVSGQAIHPEVRNLDAVLFGADDEAQLALVAQWIERLEAIVRQGRARADAITLFGGLLGERLDADRSTPTSGDAVAEGLAIAGSDGPPVDLPAVVRRLEASLGEAELARARAMVAEHSARSLEPSAAGDVASLLGRLAARRELPRATRDLLRGLAASDPEKGPSALAKELGAALTLAWEDLDAWRPAPIALTPSWARTRWRVAPRMRIVDLVLTELIGEAVDDIVTRVGGHARVNRLARSRRLIELSAPEVIIANERRMLDQTSDLRGLSRPFFWRGGERPPEGASPLEAFDAAGPIGRRRMGALLSIASGALDGEYEGYGDGDTAIAQAFALVGAELALARALRPAEPAVVIKTDLRHFFPAMPHALALGLLRWLGTDPRLVDAVERVLSAPLGPAEEVPRRGMPLRLGLSRALGSLVMAALVGSVRAAADVIAVDLVDDLVLIARSNEEAVAAWEALRAFVSDAGLELNEDKTGSVCVGGERDPRLPLGPVRWGMLELDASGGWRLDDQAIDGFAEISRARIEAHGALLDRVAMYGEQLRYLSTWLAPAADLGPDHGEAVQRAVARFDAMSFGGGQVGLRAMLRAELSSRFLDGDALGLPDAWLHWPITAGGLGVPHSGTELASVRAARAAREPVPRPAAPPSERDPDWAAWYQHRLELVEPVEPEETPEGAALVERFIARGAKVRGEPQDDLAPVWRWVLATFGPSILTHFGTFDFLRSDLVPLDVIRSGGPG
ncbi:MAG: hypothetical protein KF901_05930 [Myxococcales bacterium]|nr:hypothetical protein [Myxococcales bacterium]